MFAGLKIPMVTAPLMLLFQFSFMRRVLSTIAYVTKLTLYSRVVSIGVHTILYLA